MSEEELQAIICKLENDLFSAEEEINNLRRELWDCEREHYGL